MVIINGTSVPNENQCNSVYFHIILRKLLLENAYKTCTTLLTIFGTKLSVNFFSFADYIWVTEIMIVTGNMFKKSKIMKCYIQKDQFSWMIQTNFDM